MSSPDEKESKVDEIRGHGGFFKTAQVGQRIMAAATTDPVSLLETAGEGGAWGMALLAGFRTGKIRRRPFRTTWTRPWTVPSGKP